MIEPENQVTLRVGGSRYEGWTGVRIGAGIERVARDFSLTLKRELSNQGLPNFVGVVKQGALAEVLIGNDLVCTGFIDALPISYDDQQVSFSANGRSKTADIIDCAAIYKGGQWRGRTLGQIASDLASKYGIKVIDRGVSGAPIPEHQIDPGETALESIGRALQLRQVLAFDDEQGRLVLDRVGRERAHTALVLGENIKSADTSRDFKDCFSEYRVEGQRSGNDDDFADSTNVQQAVSLDARVSRKRVLLIKQSGQSTLASCRDRAVFERNRRAARPFETTYTVTGWRQGDGSLWRPNIRVLVWDEYLGFSGAEMVIAEVEYSFDEQGTVAVLRVGPAGAYLPEPADPKKKKRKSIDDGTEFSA